MTPQFRAGSEVRLKSQPDKAGQIQGEPRLVQGEYWYLVYFGPGQVGRHPESDLEPYQATTDVIQLLKDGRFAGREAFSKLVTQLKLATALRSHIYALQASRTNFYGYQFKPVLKVLESWKQRLLIADEVGLGKTIEAGLILTELRARQDLKRVLIVPPSHLVTKWQREMKRRFDLDFDILDRSGASRFLQAFEEEGDILRNKSIVSLQTLRGRALQERWEAIGPTFDVVIFDEAGRLRNPETLSHRVARVVAEGADAFVLLTATPIQTGWEDLFNLLRLLDPEDFSSFDVFRLRTETNTYILEALRAIQRGGEEDLRSAASLLIAMLETPYGRGLATNVLLQDVLQRLQQLRTPSRRQLIELQADLNSLNVFGTVLSRTRKREVHEAQPKREARVVACHPDPLETDFYERVTALCRQAYASAAGDVLAAFACMMPQRQMASCMPAMVNYCKQQLRESSGTPDLDEESDLRLGDYDTEDAEHVVGRVDWRRLGDLNDWEAKLEQVDSKWRALITVLDGLRRESPGTKIVLFSYFKKTLAYLERRLRAEGFGCVTISGDVPSVPDDPELDERGRRLEEFRTDARKEILLSTEVGNEGLDLQFGHVLVNYDLPWNPMVVEQRIGRLDRIGQLSDKILIFNLTMPGTIEDRILQRLYQRIGIFEHSIGDLEVILGEAVKDLTRELFSAVLTPSEVESRIEHTTRVVEGQRLLQEQLERRSAEIIGNDEFFTDAIQIARRSKRFVTPEELLLFVGDFLAAHHPKCTVAALEQPHLYELRVLEDLRHFVQQRLPQEDLGLRMFLQRSSRGKLQFTTDPVTAQNEGKLDLLTFHHPLVRAVSEYYANAAEELHPVSRLRLLDGRIAPGVLAWFVYVTDVTGARPAKDLSCVAVRLGDRTVLDSDACEELLWKMLTEAESEPAGERVVEDEAEAVYAAAEATLIERLNERFEELNRLNEAFVAGRLQSLEASFQAKRQARENRLSQARERNRDPRYVRMLEGGIRNLETDFELKRKKLEDGRRMGRSFALKAAGLVEVLHG